MQRDATTGWLGIGVKARLALVAGLLLAVLAAGCTTGRVGGGGAQAPGIVDYRRDIEALTRHVSHPLSDAELRALEARPLPPGPSPAFDAALLIRALVQSLTHNRLGLARSRADALSRGTDREIVLAIQGLHASALRGAGLFKAAREAYAAAESYMLETARRAGKPAHRMASARTLLLDYLFATLRFGDLQLGARIAAAHLEPLLHDGLVEPEVKLLARLYLADYRITQQTDWGGGDPLAGYHALVDSITTHLDEAIRTAGPLGQVARNKLMDFRIKAGHLALRAQRPSLATMQLLHVEAEIAKDVARRFAIDELRVAITLYYQEYESALATLDAMWQRAPSLVKDLRVVRTDHQVGRANVLASLGRWEDAEQALEAIGMDAPSPSLSDLHTGLRSVVRAMLGRQDPDLAAFAALEPKFREGGQGIDRSVLYFAARTAIAHHRASPDGALQAVASGRQLSRFLRRQQAAGVTDRLAMSPRFLLIAKEAYLLATLRALGRQGVTLDDVLDAVQNLQTSDIDRDIAAAVHRLRAIPGVHAGDLRQLQDLQRRVAATQAALGAALLAADANPAETQRSVDAANAVSAELEQRLAALMETSPVVREVFGGVGSLSLREIQSRLAADEALMTAVPLSTSTLVLVITKSGAARHLAPAGRRELSALVDRVRRSTDLGGFARLPDFDVDAAQQLHRLLLGWHPQGLRGVKAMTVAATGPLAAIPFGLLVGDAGRGAPARDYRRLPWLIRSVALAHVPSISSWLALASAADQRRAEGFIAWADPDYAGQTPTGAMLRRSVRAPLPVPAISLPALPETRREAQAMAQALRAAMDTAVLAGPAATRRSVLQRSASGDLARRSVVLFATHGLAPFQVPALDQPALAMALDPADPARSLLTLTDVLGLRLNADWVILSACSTASADRVGGDPLSGLSRGFFFAGVSALLVTHWEVETDSAAEITTRTVQAYAASATLSRAQALQQASLALIDAKGTAGLWSHPAYWAPYALVGDGRRRSHRP